MNEKIVITEKERETVIHNYFRGENNYTLVAIPKQFKKKLIILQHISKKFESKRKYSEKEVNEILKPIHEDYATLRRALSDLGIVSRERDCSCYWLNDDYKC